MAVLTAMLFTAGIHHSEPGHCLTSETSRDDIVLGLYSRYMAAPVMIKISYESVCI